MKKSFSVLLFLLSYSSIFGQNQKVYSREDFEVKVKPIGRLISEYNYLDMMGDGDNEALLEEKRFRNDFKEHAKNEGIDFRSFNDRSYYGLMLLVTQKGEIEYVIFNHFGDKKDTTKHAEKQAILTKLLDGFIPKFQFKSLVMGKFIINTSVLFGKEAESIRRVSKNYISTIEIAEKCDKPDTVTRLYFNQLGLGKVPQVVYRFKNLEEIDLSKNTITEIPAELTTIPKLKRLQLNFNQLKHENIHFTKNKHLEAINLQENALTTIPKEIKKNRRLNSLWIGNNNLQSLDNQAFTGLKRLEVINLYKANLKSLPTGIKKLKSLQELDLYHNKLQTLPNEVCKLKHLHTLAVSHNNIGQLPMNLSKLKYLKTLYTHHNRLFDLPELPNLSLLDIKDNSFNRFPKNIYSLNNLQNFDCSNNDLAEVPIGLTKIQSLKTCYLKTGNDFEKRKEEFDIFVAELERKNVDVR
jgi:Leucine-rich repeat (LRR) protein